MVDVLLLECCHTFLRNVNVLLCTVVYRVFKTILACCCAVTRVGFFQCVIMQLLRYSK